MNLDHLIVWLSARAEGSWPQFRDVIDRLDLHLESDAGGDPDSEKERLTRTRSSFSIYRRIRLVMQQLGHVEFFAREVENGWRVVPPTVAFLPDPAGGGILCGARLPALLENLRQSDGVKVVTSQAEGMPERILISGASGDVVAGRARALGYRIQIAAPLAILSAVPGVRDPCTRTRYSMPENPGWTIERFSPSRLQWQEVNYTTAAKARNGLFLFAMQPKWFYYYLRWRGVSYRVPRRVGIYAVMRRRHRMLAYDAQRRTLSCPARCRPPLLVERALVLCSGFLPRFDGSTRRVEYSEIPGDVARLAAQLLYQEV